MSEHESSFTRGHLLKGGAIGAAGLYLGGAGSALASRLGPAAAVEAETVTIAWLTWFGSAGGWKVTPGLSAVGPPPVTSSNQVPANRSTTLPPPYSR